MNDGPAQPQQSSPSANGQTAGSRQYVQFIFYKVDPSWRRLPTAEREAAIRLRQDRRSGAEPRDMGAADSQPAPAEGVGDSDARAIVASAVERRATSPCN